MGVNLKYLPRVYNEISNKYMKKYVHTTMVAKIAKDYIFESVVNFKKDENKFSIVKIVEETFRLIMEGSNSNSNEIWKELSLRFKKVYFIPISIN
jgi:hypothetical protein